ncbi:MAG TPA: alpha/beta hydrolase, partial [Thermoanaerobaculia bacterium]
APAGAVEACRKALSADADLVQYTTANAADDLDAVRAALGYAKIDLYARSYGTIDAQAYLRRHADRVRAAVLEGLVPPDPLAATLESPNAMRALGLLFADCAGDKACDKAFPHPDEDLEAALDHVTKQPVKAPVRDAAGKPATIEMTRERFAATVRARLFSAVEIARLPRALHRAASAELSGMAQAAWDLEHAPQPYEGALLSATCAGPLRGVDAAAVRERAAGSFWGPEPLLRKVAACAEWPVAPEAPTAAAPATATAAPVLVFSGTLDPITAPYWADRAVRGLADARQVRIPHGGHLVLDECTAGIAARFLASGKLEGLDATCAEHAMGLPFDTAP